ncbi:MAG: DUF3310 domain-containing protein [Bradyrhizobium sp.]|uniref:DUF3310 domain-containing protein n=1 Tax=Bradyrhizobium sp. TaxID=376 RepID=UPI003D12D4DB
MADNGNDHINHPAHYTHGGIEVIDAIEAWGLGFRLGNVVKYIARARHKGSQLDDLKKARWYLEREIAAVERAAESASAESAPESTFLARHLWANYPYPPTRSNGHR